MNCIEEKKKGAFFVDGPGGTGKSFLYRALLATVRSRGCIALATATSGIVASILPGGRTTHSRFKILIDLSDLKFCSISKQSSLGSLIRESKLIVWDEAPMAKKDTIEALNLALKDLCGCDDLFGGKVVVFGGEFRQVLLVLRRASRDETIGACLSSSYIWSLLTKLQLVENMRARLDPLFTEMLLRVGNGQERTYDEDLIKIPPSIAISEPLSEASLDELIRIIYPDLAYLTETELSVNRVTMKNTMQIARIDDNVRGWISLIQVVDQGPIFVSQRDPSISYRRFTFVDSEGTQVVALACNNNIRESSPILQLYKRYYVSGAAVKKEGPKCMIGSYRFSWTITNHTFIQPYVQGVVVHAFGLKNIGIDMVNRDIVLVNQEMVQMILTLWNTFGEDEGSQLAQTINAGNVVVSMRVKVTSFHGLSLSTRAASSILINPPTPATANLKQWWVILD
ncbi:Unknown protein, partial [Striga hermonthica]